VLTESNYFS